MLRYASDKYYNSQPVMTDNQYDIIREYKDFSAVINRNVQISYDNRLITGQAIDVDKQGALILRLDSGFYEKVTAGDVVMLR